MAVLRYIKKEKCNNKCTEYCIYDIHYNKLLDSFKTHNIIKLIHFWFCSYVRDDVASLFVILFEQLIIIWKDLISDSVRFIIPWIYHMENKINKRKHLLFIPTMEHLCR